MAQEVKRRRGTTAQHAVFAGAQGELTVDTDKNTVVVHDGSTLGGHPLALEGAGGASPLTTKGDLYTHDSTVNARLPVGSNGDLLTPDSAQATGLKWIAPSALPDQTAYLKTDGTRALTGDQSFNSHKGTNLAAPTAGGDAVNKTYADAGDAAAVSTAEAFATAADATQLALLIKKDGSVPFTGDQSMGSHKLTGVTDPVGAQDAATKASQDAGDAATLSSANGHSDAGDAAVTAASLQKSVVTTKGDLLAATASATIARHAAPANGSTIIADSTQTDGWKNGDHGAIGGLSDDDHPQYTLADGSRAFAGNQSMGSHEITNLAAPSAGSSAARKTDVDAAVTTAEAYADTGDALGILKDGTRAFTGPQSMGSNKLTNVTDPTAAQDAATKAYADLKVLKSTATAKGDIYGASASGTPARVPVGNDNQVLIANSGNSNGLSYGGGVDDYYNVGTSLVDSRYDGSINCTAFGTPAAPTVDTLYAYPFFVKVPIIIDRIGFKVTTLAVASKVRVGIYDTNTKSSPKPNNLIYGSGEFAGTSTGVKEETPGSGTFSISKPGLYWFAMIAGTLGPTVQTIALGCIMGVLGIDAAATGRATGWSRSQSYGALPDPFGGSLTALSQAMFQVFFRISGLL